MANRRRANKSRKSVKNSQVNINRSDDDNEGISKDPSRMSTKDKMAMKFKRMSKIKSNNEKLTNLVGLNLSFKNFIESEIEKDKSVELSSIFIKYNNFLKKDDLIIKKIE